MYDSALWLTLPSEFCFGMSEVLEEDWEGQLISCISFLASASSSLLTPIVCRSDRSFLLLNLIWPLCLLSEVADVKPACNFVTNCNKELRLSGVMSVASLVRLRDSLSRAFWTSAIKPERWSSPDSVPESWVCSFSGASNKPWSKGRRRDSPSIDWLLWSWLACLTSSVQAVKIGFWDLTEAE